MRLKTAKSAVALELGAPAAPVRSSTSGEGQRRQGDVRARSPQGPHLRRARSAGGGEVHGRQREDHALGAGRAGRGKPGRLDPARRRPPRPAAGARLSRASARRARRLRANLAAAARGGWRRASRSARSSSSSTGSRKGRSARRSARRRRSHRRSRENPERVVQVRAAADLDAVERGDRIGLLLSLEGVEPFGYELWPPDTFWELGVRMASLTWNRRNPYADGAADDGGLSRLGRALVDRLCELGVILDLAHASPALFDDVLARSGDVSGPRLARGLPCRQRPPAQRHRRPAARARGPRRAARADAPSARDRPRAADDRARDRPPRARGRDRSVSTTSVSAATSSRASAASCRRRPSRRTA